MDDTSAIIIRDSPSPTDAEIVVASKKTNNGGDTKLMQIDEEQGKDVDKQVNLKENTNEIDQGQAGSDLEHRDLPHKIDEVIHKSVRKRMFETGTYKSLPKQVALYEALEASMECANREELLTKMDKSRKRRRDGQDLPPSSPDLDFRNLYKLLLVQVRAALDISISLDVSVERVGSSFSRLILIGSSSVEVSVAPKVGAAAVASHARVLELDTYKSLKVGPLESSPPLVSIATMVSPFLCSYDFESNAEMPERHVSPTPHDAMLTRWRSRVASRSSSPTTSTPEIPVAPILPVPFAIVAPSSEFPLAPVVAPPRIHRRRAILILPREDIPIGQIYRTHPGRPYRVLITRKSVRPLPSHRLALRYTSHHLDCFTSGSSLGQSSLDHSSSRHSVLGHSLYGHTPPDTTVIDSSTPLTTSELSARDSSSESSTGPSRKRCRSLATTMTSSIHATRALVPSRADLLQSRKRFRDFISPTDSVKEGIDTNVLENIEANATAIEVAVVRDVVAEVDAGIDMEVDAVKLETFFVTHDQLDREKRMGLTYLTIDEGPFQIGMFRETLAECEEGAFHLGGQDNVDEDMDEQSVQDLALNVDNVFQADDCDAFDSDVDEAPNVHGKSIIRISYKMADENVPAPAPTRFDDQILPFDAWVIHNIHQRSTTPFHLTKEDFRLGNLKFIPKGKIDEDFRMPILDELISNNIRNASYYNAYLEMVAKHEQKIAAEKPSKASTTNPPKLKLDKEKSTKTTPLQKAGKGKITKVCKVKSPFLLVDEPDIEPAQCEPKPKLKHQGEVAVFEKTTNESDTELMQIDEEQGKDVVMDEDQAGPDPEKAVRLLLDHPKPTHDEFMTDLYPKVQESLKFMADEHWKWALKKKTKQGPK
uniref:Histone deacetylase 14 n=1 Tax=Tanacetum cinerariifolium TaxID=118510 RepID=A0A6L2NAT4_TANCI|nr:hypothetical protein [Tanacetum cinerariifolium]